MKYLVAHGCPVKRNPFVQVECPEGVYSPAEDTMLLLGEMAVAPGQRILEVGTGSGFLALHCALAGAKVVATDVAPSAIRCTRANAIASKAELDLALCSFATAIRGRYDLVIFNPPYLPGESGLKSVDGGKGGIEPASKLLEDLGRLLNDGGKLLMVLSSLSNTERLIKLFVEFTFSPVRRKRYFFEELVVYEVRATKK